jgi:WD40 repeat protein
MGDESRAEPTAKLEGHSAPVFAVCAVGDLVVTGSEDRLIKLWNARGECVATLDGHKGWVKALACLPDCAFLPSGAFASAANDGVLKVWDVAARRCAATLTGHEGPVFALCAMGAGGLASGGRDKSVRVWDPSAQKCVAKLTGHRASVGAVASLGDAVLASGSADHEIRIWNVVTRSCTTILKGHEGSVRSLAAVGSVLVSAGGDKSIRVWDLASGACAARMDGHRNAVNALVVMPGGKELVSGGGDGMFEGGTDDTALRLWDLASRSCSAVLRAHGGAVTALAVTGDGRLVSSSEDRSARTWAVKPALEEQEKTATQPAEEPAELDPQRSQHELPELLAQPSAPQPAF